MGVFFWILATATLCLQWIFISLSSTALSPELQALSAGVAIFGASFMLSWAAELAQLVALLVKARQAHETEQGGAEK